MAGDASYTVELRDYIVGEHVPFYERGKGKEIAEAVVGVDALARLSVSVKRDSGRACEVVRKASAKRFAEALVGVDRVVRSGLKRVLDAGRVYEAFSRGVLSCKLDAGVVGEVLAKVLVGVKRDSALCVDYFRSSILKSVLDVFVGEWSHVATLTGFKSLVDSGRASDVLARDAVVSRRDSVLGGDFVRLSGLRSLVDVGKVSEVVSRDVVRRFVEAVVGVDRVARGVVKPFAELSHAVDWFGSAYHKVAVLVDWLVGEHVPSKDVVLPRFDVAVSSEFVMRDTVLVRFESVLCGEYFRVSGLKRLVEVCRASEVFAKDVLKFYADVGVAVDVLRRAFLRYAWDSGFVHEYIKFRSLKSFLEACVVGEFFVKSGVWHFVDSGLVRDVLAKDVLRLYADVGRLWERFEVAGWIFVDLRDFLVGEYSYGKDVVSCKLDVGLSVDVLARAVTCVRFDSVLASDYLRVGSLRCLFDVGVGCDVLLRDVGKQFVEVARGVDVFSKDLEKFYFEVGHVVDWVLFAGWVYVVLFDSFVGEHVPLKDVGKACPDVGVVLDWKVFDLVSCLVDVVRGLDGVYRYIPLELFDRFMGDFEVGFGRIYTVRDVGKFEELVWKLGFTLAGFEVWRRVYHRVWFDLIEVADQNVKIEVAKALVNAYKSLKEKLEG
ncbi:MAG: hypothetical protein QXH20_00350 [Candidatus Bathyarchaeia archaeon]